MASALLARANGKPPSPGTSAARRAYPGPGPGSEALRGLRGRGHAAAPQPGPGCPPAHVASASARLCRELGDPTGGTRELIFPCGLSGTSERLWGWRGWGSCLTQHILGLKGLRGQGLRSPQGLKSALWVPHTPIPTASDWARTPCHPLTASATAAPTHTPRPKSLPGCKDPDTKMPEWGGGPRQHQRTATGLLRVRALDLPAAAPVLASALELKAPVKLGLGSPKGPPGCLVSEWQQLWAVSSLSGPTPVAQPGDPLTASSEGSQGPQGQS